MGRRPKIARRNYNVLTIPRTSLWKSYYFTLQSKKLSENRKNFRSLISNVIYGESLRIVTMSGEFKVISNGINTLINPRTFRPRGESNSLINFSFKTKFSISFFYDKYFVLNTPITSRLSRRGLLPIQDRLRIIVKFKVNAPKLRSLSDMGKMWYCSNFLSYNRFNFFEKFLNIWYFYYKYWFWATGRDIRVHIPFNTNHQFAFHFLHNRCTEF